MKKINLFLLFIVTCVFSIGVVKADMGMPDYNEVDAVVINPNGIEVDDNGKKVKKEYGTRIKVGKLGNNIYCNYDIIDPGDIKIVAEEFDTTEYEKMIRTKEIKTLKSTYLYSGPSSLYSQVVEIPENTTLYVQNYSNYDDTFVYTEYNGNKGFVDVYNFYNDCWIAEKNKNNYYFTKNKYVVYSFPDSEGSYVEKELDKDEIFTTSYTFINQPKSIWLYIDELDGWIFRNYAGYVVDEEGIDILSNYAGSIYLRKDIKTMYTNLYSNETVSVDIKKESILNFDFSYMPYMDKALCYFYVEYNGVKGWIKLDTIEEYSDNVTRYITTSSVSLYEDSSFKKLALTLKSNEELTGINILDSNYKVKESFVIYNNKKYYMKNTDNLASDDKGKIKNVRGNSYIYEEINSDSKKVGAVKKYDEYTELYSTKKKKSSNNCEINWTYIDYKGTKGWINIQYCSEDYRYYTSGYNNVVNEISDEELEKFYQENNIKLEEANNENTSETKNVDINSILPFIIGGVALSLTALVIIIIICKKKTNKNIV